MNCSDYPHETQGLIARRWSIGDRVLVDGKYPATVRFQSTTVPVVVVLADGNTDSQHVHPDRLSPLV